MDTILEFIQFTKATEYLLAVAFLFGFIAFWQLLWHRGRGLLVRVVPSVVLSTGFAGLTVSLLATNATEQPQVPQPEKPFLSVTVLAKLYGPAAFDHDAHLRLTDECAFCHHKSGEATPPCKTCHTPEHDPQNLAKPALAHVYHVRCIGCHKENQIGPTVCAGCHLEAAVPPLTLKHPLTDIADCIGCHGSDMPGIPLMPPDHADATNGVCQLCHKPQLDPEALAKRAMPHEIEGFEECLLCHGEGIAEAPGVPEDHTGRTDQMCAMCHMVPQQIP